MYDKTAGEFCDNFKIENENENDVEIIENFFLNKNQLFVISKREQEKFKLSVRGYILDSNKV